MKLRAGMKCEKGTKKVDAMPPATKLRARIHTLLKCGDDKAITLWSVSENDAQCASFTSPSQQRNLALSSLKGKR